ncbi:MAG: MraY family glycosyltransferase [Candidatus Omnitrophota bacterium]
MILAVIFCGIFSFIVSYALSQWLLKNAGIFSKGRRVFAERVRLHKKGVPRLGGIAIFGSFYATLLLIFIFKRDLFYNREIKLVGVFLASAIIVATGIYDDLIKRLGYKVKFALQILAVIVVIIFGYNIKIITNPLGGEIYVGFLGPIFVLLWMLAVINAINLIDGLDGLACGIATVACASFFIIALSQNNIFLALIIISIIGANLAFLRYNFYPAKLFLGDSGSFFLGFMLAVLVMESYIKRSAVISLSVPFLTLFIPMGSVVFTFSRRIAAARNPFRPDRMHLHYRFLRAGVSHRNTVLIYLCITLIYATLGTFCFFLPKKFELTIIVFAGVTIWCFYMWVSHFMSTRQKFKKRASKQYS